MMPFTYSSSGLALTKRFEGLRLDSYRDIRGIWTIGYGHVDGTIRAGQRITLAMADILLRSDVVGCEHFVNSVVTIGISQPKFDALVDFGFNVGCHNLGESTLLKLVNAGNFAAAADEFPKWAHAGGVYVEALEKRRLEERAEFLAACAEDDDRDWDKEYEEIMGNERLRLLWEQSLFREEEFEVGNLITL